MHSKLHHRTAFYHNKGLGHIKETNPTSKDIQPHQRLLTVVTEEELVGTLWAHEPRERSAQHLQPPGEHRGGRQAVIT